jgi:hypothetical protein
MAIFNSYVKLPEGKSGIYSVSFTKGVSLFGGCRRLYLVHPIVPYMFPIVSPRISNYVTCICIFGGCWNKHALIKSSKTWGHRGSPGGYLGDLAMLEAHVPQMPHCGSVL